MSKNVEQLERVVIRIAGDSGDGMQLTGDRFTQETARFGNDLATFPNFPAEIRAPQGTLAGVSSFQLHFADHDILTPGDRPDVLVAMNPAALKANLGEVPKGATIIVDTRDFTTRALARVGWSANPLEDGTLEGYQVHAFDLTQLTLDALTGSELSRKDAGRSKNMFALGLLSWMYSRPTEGTIEFIRAKFQARPEIADANVTAFQAGWNFGETTEAFGVSYEIKPATVAPGTYRNISGNLALAYGLVTAARRAQLPLFLGAYPITPASDILHELSKHKRFGVRTFQAEDEIAGIGAALGAAFGGSLAVTTSSGPGVALKGETIGLAVSLELPLRGVRHPARRAVDRPADQDRAVGPAAGDVRAQRRGPGADRRPPLPRRLLRRGAGGGADRADLPHAGVPAVRRLPGQRLGAVGGALGVPAARPAGRVRHRPERHRGFSRRVSALICATRRPWPGRGRCRVRQGWSTASAASRRPTAPATSPTTPTTTTT